MAGVVYIWLIRRFRTMLGEYTTDYGRIELTPGLTRVTHDSVGVDLQLDRKVSMFLVAPETDKVQGGLIPREFHAL